MKEAIFSEAVLVSNYHGCKEEVMKLIPCCITIIIYRTVKPSHFKKLQIIQNIENLMLQVIFKISDIVLIKKIIVFSTPFSCWVKQTFERMMPGEMSNFLLPRA